MTQKEAASSYSLEWLQTSASNFQGYSVRKEYSLDPTLLYMDVCCSQISPTPSPHSLWVESGNETNCSQVHVSWVVLEIRNNRQNT